MQKTKNATARAVAYMFNDPRRMFVLQPAFPVVKATLSAKEALDKVWAVRPRSLTLRERYEASRKSAS